MNPLKDELDPRLAKKLAVLNTVPPRNPEMADKRRAEFLLQAQSAAEGVSAPESPRRNGWMQTLQSIFQQKKKERSPMFGTLATIFLIVSLLLGGGGATLAMAQSSLPDQPLYGVKLASEEIRMGLAANPESQVELALKFADQRAEEIQRMLKTNAAPPESVLARYQQQIEQAIQTAVRMQREAASGALEMVQARMQIHLHAFEQLGLNADAPGAAILARIRSMLQERLGWAEEGIADPLKLQDQLRQRERDPQQTSQPAGAQNGQISHTPPGTGGGNPWTTGTPTPGSGYGPGPGTGDCTTCTPQGTGQGSNPWTTGTPTPGSGYGAPPTGTPGSGNGGMNPTANIQPTGSGSGPQPSAAPGGPGGKK